MADEAGGNLMATKQEQESFIEKIAPIIQREAAKHGYKICSAVIAQACVESAYGQSGLAKYHNYFGLKCGSKWTGKSVNMSTKEEYNGSLVSIKDNFRVYDSMEDGVAGYYSFISSKRYDNLKRAVSAKQYLEFIKADGYATSSLYVNTNMGVVNLHHLERFDGNVEDSAPKTGNPYDEPVATIKLNMKGNGVRWVQYQLNLRGYKLVVDGIAGKMTIGAVLDFQRKNGLKMDGMVGPQTRQKLAE